MSIKQYRENQENRKMTPQGEKSMAESKAMIKKVKSMPMAVVKKAGRVATSTGSMLRRGVEAVFPKRTIVIKKK